MDPQVFAVHVLLFLLQVPRQLPHAALQLHDGVLQVLNGAVLVLDHRLPQLRVLLPQHRCSAWLFGAGRPAVVGPRHWAVRSPALHLGGLVAGLGALQHSA
uniref:Secreted protein n=1 Tax=Eutreptiella gymnastica TaxID=73025 RepID=A0A7S4FJD9_9EUGL